MAVWHHEFESSEFLAMDPNLIREGIRVRVAKLDRRQALLICPKHYGVRKEGSVGVVLSFVAGSEGELWRVQDEVTKEAGAYWYYELEPA
jgi:hypothetical protein